MHKRYGLIGSCYNTGISNIAWGFAEHLDMKALLYDYKPFTTFPERFKNRRLTKDITKEDIEWLLSDIDVLFTIETPYYWPVYEEAWKRHIKTVLMPMIEWLDRGRPELRSVDLFVCPSTYTERVMWNKGYRNTVLVPCEVPVDLKRFPKRKFSRIRTFLHNAGHGGLKGRNSTYELMRAIKLVQCDARFIIRSQFPITEKIEDPRITYIEGNVENYWDLYEEGDCWLMPWKYGVAALGLQESMAAGMIPCITDMEPFNEFMPKGLLIEPERLDWRTVNCGQQELWAEQSTANIARTIERLYSERDVRPWLDWSRATAKAWSWDIWQKKYQEMFDAL
jgi:hypothetical protein